MSFLLESVVGGSATDLDGALSAPLDEDRLAGFLGRTGYLGDQKGLTGGGDGGRKEKRRSLSSLSGVRFKVAESDEGSSESSSIGAPDDSDEEETGSGDDEDEMQSARRSRRLSYYQMSIVSAMCQNLANHFNKRRRNILAYKLSSWSTSSSSSPSKRRMMINDNIYSFYGHRNPIPMPLLPLHEHDDEDDDDDYKDDIETHGGSTTDLRRSDLHLGIKEEIHLCI